MSAQLGEKIKMLRKQKGLSIEKLGEISGTSKSYIWEIENRNSSNPTADKLAKISEALGVTTDYLMNDTQSLTIEVLREAFFRKLSQLNEDDQMKIGQLIDVWSSNNK